MTRRIIGIFLLSTSFSFAQATMIANKGDWTGLSESEQFGYVMAVVDSHYFVYNSEETEGEKKHKALTRECISDWDTRDLIEIVNMRYESVEHFNQPAWFHLMDGIRAACGLSQ